MEASDVNLAASAEIAVTAERLAPGIRVRSVTNGVDTSVFKPTELNLPETIVGRRRLIVPRRLFKKNGVEFAIQALPMIAERHDVEMLIIGDGPERENLASIAAGLGVKERVIFLGARPHTEMPALLSSSDLAIFPSLMEATSVAALECMACEIPVAASRVGGLPEIVDTTVGGLFDPADAKGLALIVGQMLDDPGLSMKGKAARARVLLRWSNERLTQYHIELYEEILGGWVRR